MAEIPTIQDRKLSSPESSSANIIRLKDIGFVDRHEKNLGLANASIDLKTTINPATGNSVYVGRIDYPINGLGLERLLTATSPVDRPGDRQAILADWNLPDVAARLIAQGKEDDGEVARHKRHQRLPQYNEFDTNHRATWMHVLNDTTFDREYKIAAQVQFINTRLFAKESLGELEQIQMHPYGGPGGDKRRSLLSYLAQTEAGKTFVEYIASMPLEQRRSIGSQARQLQLVTSLQEFGKEVDEVNRKDRENPESLWGKITLVFHKPDAQMQELFATALFLLRSKKVPEDIRNNVLIGNNVAHGLELSTFVDPVTLQKWNTNEEWDSPRQEVTIPLHVSDTMARTGTENISIEVALDKLDKNGRYMSQAMSFSPEYTASSIYPLLAWEETPTGGRFLSQQEAESMMPERFKDTRGDVVLGRVALGYLEPHVTDEFLCTMPLPPGEVHSERDQRLAGIRQEMMAAQMPVWVSLPGYARQLLKTQAVTQLKKFAAGL